MMCAEEETGGLDACPVQYRIMQGLVGGVAPDLQVLLFHAYVAVSS